MPFRDWFPTIREKILAMVDAWLFVLGLKGALFGVPATLIAELNDQAVVVRNLMATAITSARTPILTAQIQAAVRELEVKMRFIKNRWFHKPPLLDEDFVALLLSPPDEVRTHDGPPIAHAFIKTGYDGPHRLVVTTETAEGEQKPEGPVWINIYGGKLPPGGASLEAIARNKLLLDREPKTLPEIISLIRTQRKVEILEFNPEDSGSTMFLSAVYENRRGQAGPPGVIVHAVIP